MFTFRASITLTVMIFVVALAALLIAIQVQSLHWATREAASAYMDAASNKALGRLQGELNAIASLVNVLATSSSVADSNERSETGRAIPLFKAALQRTAADGQHLCRLRKWRMAAGAADQRPYRRSARSAACTAAFRPGDQPGSSDPGGRPADAADLSGSSRTTRSVKSICGSTDTTPASAPGTGKR